MTPTTSFEFGGSYVETLVALVLVAICVSAIGSSVGAVVGSSDLLLERWQRNERMASRLEQVGSLAAETLRAEYERLGDESVETRWSDSSGVQHRLLVFLREVDLDNADTDNNPGTGADSGPLLIEVLESDSGLTIETLGRNP